MARRLHLFLLSLVAGAGLVPGGALAQEQGATVASPEPTPQVVEPQVERRTVKPPKVPTENFEVGVLLGAISIEDFGTSMVYGSRIAYHFTEDIFAEMSVGQAQAGKTSFEYPSGARKLLSDSQRDFTYYDLSLGWNVLPGEVFLGTKRAMPSALYVTSGVGSTRFGGDDHMTATVGAGVRLIVNDWLALHVDARDQMFKLDLLGNEKINHNLQFSISATAFF